MGNFPGRLSGWLAFPPLVFRKLRASCLMKTISIDNAAIGARSTGAEHVASFVALPLIFFPAFVAFARRDSTPTSENLFHNPFPPNGYLSFLKQRSTLLGARACGLLRSHCFAIRSLPSPAIQRRNFAPSPLGSADTFFRRLSTSGVKSISIFLP